MNKKTIIILTAIIILILILGLGLFWYLNQQKIERQYQTCLDKCDSKGDPKFRNVVESAFSTGNKITTFNTDGCKAECRETYAK